VNYVTETPGRLHKLGIIRCVRVPITVLGCPKRE
jgi:hypothetical protein